MCAEIGFKPEFYPLQRTVSNEDGKQDTTSGDVGIFAPFTLQNVYSLFVTVN